jgi:hypothetical protein
VTGALAIKTLMLSCEVVSAFAQEKAYLQGNTFRRLVFSTFG